MTTGSGTEPKKVRKVDKNPRISKYVYLLVLKVYMIQHDMYVGVLRSKFGTSRAIR